MNVAPLGVRSYAFEAHLSVAKRPVGAEGHAEGSYSRAQCGGIRRHNRIRGRLAGLGQDIFPPERRTPEALGAYHKAEIAKWWPIIKAAGIKAE